MDKPDEIQQQHQEDQQQARGEVVVLTGASGCLGFHTLRLLVREDDSVCEVRCLDLVAPEASMERLVKQEVEKRNSKKPTKGNKVNKIKLIRIKGDIRDINLVERVLEGAQCVLHCAASIEAWTEKSRQNQQQLRSINVDGTEMLLKTAIRLGVHKFVHVSSFEAYLGYDTIYYATESTLPDTENLLFGPSGLSKRDAEAKVRQYSNVKLQRIATVGCNRPSSGAKLECCRQQDSLRAVVLRFPTIYGEFDRHYVSKILEMSQFFSGKLQRMSNIWIRQQPIYAENAAWSLVKAKQRLDNDASISGEDDTPIGDPFDFVEPFLESKGMRVTKRAYPFIPIWMLLLLFFVLKAFFGRLDFLDLLSTKKDRYQEAVENDIAKATARAESESESKTGCKPTSERRQAANACKSKRWYDYVTPSTMFFMCNSSFLNRTKASLRLDYNPLVSPDEAKRRSLDWYKNHLRL